jgi:low temperature requirement protein LtrA
MAIEVPQPHREARLIGSPTVTWFELFYDLVVVAAVSLTNDVFLARPTAGTAVTAAVCMTALAWVWFLTTLFNNLFPGQDILRRLLLVLQMGAIVVAGLAADQDHGITHRAGLVAYGVALAIVAVLIVSGGRRAGGPVPRATVLALTLAAAICCLGGLDANLHSGYYLVAALVVSMVPILLRQYSQA